MVTYDIDLLLVLCMGYSSDFLSWALQTSSGMSGWAGTNAVLWNVMLSLPGVSPMVGVAASST